MNTKKFLFYVVDAKRNNVIKHVDVSKTTDLLIKTDQVPAWDFRCMDTKSHYSSGQWMTNPEEGSVAYRSFSTVKHHTLPDTSAQCSTSSTSYYIKNVSLACSFSFYFYSYILHNLLFYYYTITLFWLVKYVWKKNYFKWHHNLFWILLISVDFFF